MVNVWDCSNRNTIENKAVVPYIFANEAVLNAPKC